MAVIWLAAAVAQDTAVWSRDVELGKIALGSGPLLMVHAEPAADGRERVFVATPNDELRLRELACARPGFRVRLLRRLDRHRVLGFGGESMTAARLHVFDVQTGRCLDLGVDANAYVHVAGDLLVYARDREIGVLPWDGSRAACVVRAPRLLAVGVVGSTLYAVGEERLFRVDLDNPVLRAFGPVIDGEDISLSIAPDGSRYAIGRWSRLPAIEGEVVGGDDGPACYGVRFGEVTVHETATDAVSKTWPDVAERFSVWDSDLPRPPTCVWFSAAEVGLQRWTAGTSTELVAVSVDTGAQRSRRGAMPADTQVGAAPASYDVLLRWPGSGPPRELRSTDGTWELVANDLVHVPTGRRQALGSFVIRDAVWLPDS